MKTLARTTGIIFILVGLIVVIAGIVFLVRAGLKPTPFAPSLFGGAELEAMLTPLRLFAGGLMSMQGLMLAAVGEGLWLLADIAENSGKR